MKILVSLFAMMAVTSGYSYSAMMPAYGIGPVVHNDLFPIMNHALHYPVMKASNQYQTESGFGHISYGHIQSDQMHTAIQDAAGNKAGTFSYMKPDGSIARTEYVADDLGYRVISNNAHISPIMTRGATEYLPIFRMKRYRREDGKLPVIHPFSGQHESHISTDAITKSHDLPSHIAKRSTGPSVVTKPQEPNRYPELTPDPQTHLYTNTKVGQEYASHYPTGKQ